MATWLDVSRACIRATADLHPTKRTMYRAIDVAQLIDANPAERLAIEAAWALALEEEHNANEL